MSIDLLTGVLVKEVMTSKPVAVSPTTSVRDLAEILDTNEISGVPVVDVQDRVIGVVSKTDLLHQWIHGSPNGGSSSLIELLEEGIRNDDLDIDLHETVDEFMSGDPVTASPEDSLTEVARRMVQERVHRVIVTDEKMRLLGIVTTLDVLKYISE